MPKLIKRASRDFQIDEQTLIMVKLSVKVWTLRNINMNVFLLRVDFIRIKNEVVPKVINKIE